MIYENGGGVAALLATSLSVAGPASAFTGLSFSSPGATNVDSTDTLGYQFQVGASSISLTGLGFYDFGQDGLQTAHDVGLWNNSGSLLTQVSVASGTSAPLVGFYRYAAVTPITLASGQTYTVGGLFQTGTDKYSYNIVGLTSDPAINIIIPTVYNTGSTLTMPTSSFPGNNFTGADIQFTTATPVPFEFEPTGGLMVLGGAWLLRRHLKNKKSTKV